MYYTDNDFRLYHHGVLGQKWGVRRYQNTDGSLTAAGRKRLAKDLKKAAKKSGDGQELQNHVDRVLTNDQRARLREASDKLNDRLNSIDDDKNAAKRTDEIVKEVDRLVDDEMRRNPTAYRSERDLRKLREAYEDLAEENVAKKHPELFAEEKSIDKAFDAYQKDLENIGKEILKEYSDVPINVNNTGYSYKSDAKKLIADALNEIDSRQRQDEKLIKRMDEADNFGAKRYDELLNKGYDEDRAFNMATREVAEKYSDVYPDIEDVFIDDNLRPSRQR